MMPAQVALRVEEVKGADGLRSRKKAKTRHAIEDAALSLFDEFGYEATTVAEIAARAEISVPTFFRYYASKTEVLLSDHGEQLPALHQAILDRPVTESDLVAVREAVQREWVAAIDPVLTARKARIVATSDALSGSSYHRGHRWLEVITDALARRHGLDVPDERCSLAARVVLGVLGAGVEEWMANGCLGELSDVINHRFELMTRLCGDWSGRGAEGSASSDGA